MTNNIFKMTFTQRLVKEMAATLLILRNVKQRIQDYKGQVINTTSKIMTVKYQKLIKFKTKKI